MALKTKAKFPSFIWILYLYFKRRGRLQRNASKGLIVNRLRFEFHIMTWLSIAVFDTGKVPTPLCNTNQHKMQQSGVAKGKYSTTISQYKKKSPAVFIFKAVWARSFIHSKRRKKRKEKLQRAYCLTAGSVSVRRDYLYSTLPHYDSIKLEIFVLCVDSWLQFDCDFGWTLSGIKP